MKQRVSVIVAAIVVALLGGQASAQPTQSFFGFLPFVPVGAVYTMSNAADGNAVLIRGALDRDHPGRRADAPSRAWRPPVALAAGLAALLIVAVGAGLWWWFRPPTPVEIASDYVSLADGTLRLDAATADPRALERYFTAQGGVPNRVHDLAMMQYTLVGGRVQPHRGHPGTLAVYRGAHGEHVIEPSSRGVHSNRRRRERV